MNIINRNIASIRNNDPEGDRINLSIAREVIDGEIRYFVAADTGDDTGPHFASAAEAQDAIEAMWGKSPEWDLQYA